MNEKQQIVHVQHAFLYNLYENNHKFPSVTMFRAEEVNTGTNESEFGCDPQDSVGKFTYICQFKRVDGNKRKKVFLEKRTHILIARDVFLALAFIVAKAPYSHESDSSISVLLQLI